MKKKITALCLCVALLAVAVVGASLAYFTDTKSATNTFTVGNVKIDLIESQFHREGNDNSGDTSIPDPTHKVVADDGMKYVTTGHTMFTNDEIKADAETYQDKYLAVKGENMVPGRGVAKCPYVVNTGANDAYIRIRVMIPSDANRDYWQARSGGVIESQFCTTAITSGEFMHNDKTTYNPFIDASGRGYVDENGEYQGYDVYFARRLAEDLGVETNFVSTEAANRIEYLQTGKVDIILANFTVTPERAEEVDFALPYMNVALGVVSPDSNVITSLDNWNADDQMIVISGTTAETYLTKEYPDIPLQKYDSYATAKNALENGNGAAWANDNTEVIAFAKQNSGYTVGIPSLGSQDTIAPAVSKGNTTLLDWINDEIKSLGEESFFHKDYEETLVDTYGLDYEDELVVEGGEANA